MIDGYDNKLLQSFEYETTAISNKKIIGTCELGKATIQLLNDSNTFSELKGTWIKTKFGSFYIDDVEPVQEKINIKLSCYDIKYKLDTEYDTSLYIFPMTLKEWRNAIFTSCGVEYDNSDFPNSDLLLETEPYIGDAKTNRQVLCIIAQAGISWIETDENDKFYFKWFTNNEFIVKDWSSLTTEKKPTDSVNLVVLGRGDVEDIVYYPKTKPDNPVEFKIDNNYILDPQDTTSDEDLRETTIIPIYDRVNGLNYIVYDLTATQIDNKLSIKLGDKITYIDIWGNELTSYIMTRKISFIGGDVEDDDNYQITLSAEEIEETNTDLSIGVDVVSKISEVSIKVDKEAEKIVLLNQEVNENKENIASLTIENNEIRSSVYTKEQMNELILNSETGLTNIFKNVGGNNLLKNSALYFKTNDTYDYWTGNAEKIIYSESQSNTAIKLKNNSFKQSVSLANGNYTLSFKYKRLNELGSASVKINNETSSLDADGEFKKTLSIETNQIELEFNTTLDDSYIIYDLMLNTGIEASTWSQYQNEVHTDTVNISKGVEIEATENDTKAIFGAKGLNVINKYTNADVLKATDTGIETTDIKSDKGTIGGMLVKKVQNQTWITGV